MANTHDSLLVILDDNLTEEQLKPIKDAISQLKGVCSVKGNVTDSVSEYCAMVRTKHELASKLSGIIREMYQ